MKLYKAIQKTADGGFFESDHYYSCEEEAMAWCEKSFYALFKTGPCIEVDAYEPILPPSWKVKESRKKIENQFLKPAQKLIPNPKKDEKNQNDKSSQVSFEHFFGSHVSSKDD